MSIRALVPTASIALLVALAACGGDDGGGSGGEASPDSVTIGVPLSLSGTSAFSGQDSERGIELAVAELESGILEGVEIELSVVDDASDPNQAVTAVQRLVSDEVLTLVGGTVSNAVQAAAPLAQRAGVPFVVINSFNPELTDVGDYIFQTSQPTGPFNADEVNAAVEAFSPEKVAIIYAQDVPTTVAFNDDFVQAFEDAGVEVVADEAVSNADADYSASIRRVMDLDPDIIVPLLTGTQDALIVTQARSFGYDGVFLGHVGDVNASFVTGAQADAVGHIANAGFFSGADTQPVTDFVADYEEAQGESPSAIAAQAYQAMMMTGTAIANLIEAGDELTPQAVRDALEQVGEVDSVLGSTGTAQFEDRILRHEGFLLRLNDSLEWEIWQP